MKRGKKIDTWYPFFIDKWLFGSTRHELIVRKEDGQIIDLRGIWMDLLTLSKKDGGWIRANETTPYPLEQLAGMFYVPIELLKMTITIVKKKNKISEPSPGIFFVLSEGSGAYSITDRWKREKEKGFGQSSLFAEQTSESPEAILKETKGNKSKENIKSYPSPLSEEAIDFQFKSFWAAYPREGREAKVESRKKFGARLKEGNLAGIIKAVNNYNDFLRYEKNERNFNRRAMGAKVFLGDRWKEFVDLKVEKPL
jgi:hypothetical protein